MIESYLNKNNNWLWDHQGFYMQRQGNAFLRLIPKKGLI